MLGVYELVYGYCMLKPLMGHIDLYVLIFLE